MAVRSAILSALAAAAGAIVLAVIPASSAESQVPEGAVMAFGDAVPAEAPILEDLISIASTSTGLGWWATSPTGSVVSAGDALAVGTSPTSAPLNSPIVGIAAMPSAAGFWLVAGDGGIFSYGSARFYGSTGAMVLNSPIVGMGATPSGRGYWLVASDGGIFSFGDARFHGSTGAMVLNSPIVGMSPTPSGRGYWLVASDGGVFSFGDARSAGSLGGAPIDAPVTAMAPTPSGRGYWLLRSDGVVTPFGDATDHGSLAGRVRDAAAVSISASRSGIGYRIGVGRVRDVVTVWQHGGMSATSQQWAIDVAQRAGARAVVRHSATLNLPVGDGTWRIPLSTRAVEPTPAIPLVGPSAAAALARGDVVLSRGSASLRNAKVGDSIRLIGADGRQRSRTIGAIASDARVSEVNLSIVDAASMGVSRPLSVDIWGASRRAIDDALASAPPMPTRLGVDRSWLNDSVDDVLGSVSLKRLVGEVAYHPTGGGSVALDPSWVGSNIVRASVPVLGTVTCHRVVIPALRAALTEVANAHLGGALGRYGGCYVPRYIRGGDSGGALSRHSYGIAVDLNITNNTYGGRVSMDPRVVDIFRRWGFAWGGTWLKADGMHFEYTRVGDRSRISPG